MSESDHQIAVVDWFEKAYPKHAHMLMAYPSGTIIGGKNKFGLINKMKREGWRSGVPDLLLMVPAGSWHGLVIEMKDFGKTKSSLSENQKFYLDEFAKCGYFTEWCPGSEAAIFAIEQYMVHVLYHELKSDK